MDFEPLRFWEGIVRDGHLSIGTRSLERGSLQSALLAGDRPLSRRQLLTTAAGAFAVAATWSLWLPGLVRLASAQDALPRPISGGRSAPPAPEIFFHEYPVARGNEPSTITDFKGYFGVASIDVGPATRRDKRTGATTNLLWRAEMRALKGIYVGTDGQEHRGTFGFI